MNKDRLDKMKKRHNDATGKDFKYSGYSKFAGAEKRFTRYRVAECNDGLYQAAYVD